MSDARTRAGLSPSELNRRATSIVETRGADTLISTQPLLQLPHEDFKPDATPEELAEQLERLRQYCRQYFAALSSNPMTFGTYIKDVSFVSTSSPAYTTVVQHRLKATPRVMMTVGSAGITMSVSNSTSYDVTLVASANCTVDLFIYPAPGGQ